MIGEVLEVQVNVQAINISVGCRSNKSQIKEEEMTQA